MIEEVDLSIVLPCYNEIEALPVLLPRLEKIYRSIQKQGLKIEVILVDDGSTDESHKTLQDFPEFLIERHSACSGYGEALKTGFKKARGKSVVFLDVDNTYWPEDLPQLLQKAEATNSDMIMGVRSFFDSGMPVARAFGNTFFSWSAWGFFGKNIEDMSTGFRLIRQNRIPEVLALKSGGLHFSMELTLTAIENSWKLDSTPIRYAERLGSSKLNLVVDGIRFFWLMLKYRARQTKAAEKLRKENALVRH